jgi:hypothetical protein
MSKLVPRRRRMPGVCITSALFADATEDEDLTPVATLTKFNIATQVQNGVRIFMIGPRCCGKTLLVERLLQTTRMKATVIEDGSAEDVLDLFTTANVTNATPALRIATACYASVDLYLCCCMDIAIAFPTTSQAMIHNWRIHAFPCFKTDNELATMFTTLIGMKDAALVFDASAFRSQTPPYLFWI